MRLWVLNFCSVHGLCFPYGCFQILFNQPRCLHSSFWNVDHLSLLPGVFASLSLASVKDPLDVKTVSFFIKEVASL
ncbi:hypothetical protein VIGAN_05225300 [Vigna angularis var. angularis]|uniref:Uncharacterized protein n=1 Tax=Vigna angularis var. angularis TaxID=157739 RepID=A0A0S3S772_PHAAN|nr:hypothetical protein VIGAN_05225300 [Vigna angularis var. angularis]